MTHTFTKGREWTATFDAQGGYDCMTAAWRIESDGRTIAVVDYENWDAPHFDATPVKEADEVARLIAAAPELLAAAQDAFATLLRLRECGTIGDSPSIRLLGAAIKRARGES